MIDNSMSPTQAKLIFRVATCCVKRLLNYEPTTEDKFNELHNILTENLMRLKSGRFTKTKAAIDWLHKNDISGVAYEGNPLDKLQMSSTDRS